MVYVSVMLDIACLPGAGNCIFQYPDEFLCPVCALDNVEYVFGDNAAVARS
jgi:hypothetical protein